MTDDVRYERIIEALPEQVFDALNCDGGQLASYGQDDPDWIVHCETVLR